MLIHKRMRAKRWPSRPAVTLIELLVVMAVMILLVGVSLPSFRTMLQDQKVAQGSRIVQLMIENAQARAIALGRPVAVVFDRTAADPAAPAAFNHVSDNTCTRISMGEVFPPYEGDWAGSTGTLSDTNSDGAPETLTIEIAKVSSIAGLVSSGDLLQLGDHRQTFSITSVTVASGVATVLFQNPPSGYTSEDALWNVSTAEIRFRMIRRPSKSLAGSTALPRGICVDLSQSGVGPGGNQFWVAPRVGLQPANRYGPVFVVFNSNGRMEGSYYLLNPPTPTPRVDITTPGVLHLLVGRTEQVEPTGSILGTPTDQFTPNLFDPRNTWISVNPYSGAIYSTPVAPGVPTGTPAVDRANARKFALAGRTGQES